MADYYPLVAKAVAGLEKNTGEGRRLLYERARTALVAQLRGMNDPPLTEAEITRERLALEEAIRKVEAEAARRGRDAPRPEAPPPAAPKADAEPSAVPPPKPAPTAAAERLVEMEFWNSVKESDQYEMVAAYLDKYPNGEFVELATLRLRELSDRGR